MSHDTNKIKVLIIDDSRVVRVAASRMFSDDFDVLLAVDGADGLAMIERDPEIHVVFTDLAMPVMDGFELLSAIREHTDGNVRNLPVIVATGAGNPESARQKAFKLGATDFVTKPFNATDLKARARSYATLRQENRSLKQFATIDEMTGLLNSKGFNMQLDKEISFAARHRSSLTLLAIEIDGYKDLFVRIGREGTEKVVNRVANVLKETFRKEDSVARVGVARFLIGMPMSYAYNAVDLAHRICHTVESFKAKLDGKRIKITVSIGVGNIYIDDDINAHTLVGLAEEALRKANDSGASQIAELTLDDYKHQLREQAKKNLSIDNLLDLINEKSLAFDKAQLEIAVDRLMPLFKLFSDQQAQKLYFSRKQPTGKVLDFNSNSQRTNK